MGEATQPYVCDECKKLDKNWYAPCPHVPLRASPVAPAPKCSAAELRMVQAAQPELLACAKEIASALAATKTNNQWVSIIVGKLRALAPERVTQLVATGES